MKRLLSILILLWCHVASAQFMSAHRLALLGHHTTADASIPFQDSLRFAFFAASGIYTNTDGTGVPTTANAPITFWDGGSGYLLQTNSGSQPTLQLAQDGSLNAINLNGSAFSMFDSSWFAPSNTYYIVCRLTQTNNVSTIFSAGLASLEWRFDVGHQRLVLTSVADVGLSTTGESSNVWFSANVSWDGVGGIGKFRLNGSDDGTLAGTSQTGVLPNKYFGVHELDSPDAFATMDVVALLIYSQVQTAADRQTVESVLSTITPATHADHFIGFRRYQSDPVLTRGGTYDGWQADDLAAPALTQTSSNYIMAPSLWSTNLSKWATGFFTSSNLVNWDYVSGSLLTPQGSDYIVGNGDLQEYKGALFFAYNHYPKAGPSGIMNIDVATNGVLGWTNVFSGGGVSRDDVHFASNSITGKLELWYLTSDKKIAMSDTSDGFTWTDEGVQKTSSFYNVSAFGSPDVYYFNNQRALIFDGAPNTIARHENLAVSVNADSTWIDYGTCLGPSYLNVWDGSQVFDMRVIVTDRGDGRGAVPWGVYAGGTNASPTDATGSSLGLVFKK